MLYTSNPPGRRESHISDNMARWRATQVFTFDGDHIETARASLRNIPSPEHGASTTIISKNSLKGAKSAGSLRVTTALGAPHFIIFSASTPARRGIGSLATNREPSGNRESAWVDFPPGAAQRSSIRTGASTYCLNTCSRNIEEASCT